VECPQCGFINPEERRRCLRCRLIFDADPASIDRPETIASSAFRTPLAGEDNASNRRQVRFFATDLLPNPALPKIGRVNADGGRLEVFLDMSPGAPFGPESGSSALRQRWLLDVIDLLLFLHAQVPFPIALGGINVETFEIIHEQVRLVRLGLDFNGSKRSIEADVRGFSDFASYVLPEVAATLESLRVDSSSLTLAEIRSAISGKSAQSIEELCECGTPIPRFSRFCVRCGKPLVSGSSGQQLLTLRVETESEADLLVAWNEGRIAPHRRQRLALAIDGLRATPGFDRLLCVDRLSNLTRMFYQEEAALRVLGGMRGRALLADEVGLGKTIEAGLIIKELLVRGLVNSILVICPNSLISQWQAELFEKFNELLLVLGRDVDTTLAWRCGRLIASYESIEERWHAEELQTQNFDLVILDEAHYLNDPENVRALETVRSLRKRYFLLLSATPMHNDLGEFHNILTLLRPGHVGTRREFLSTYVDPDPNSKSGARNLGALRRIVQEVMIRNLRTNVAKDHRFPRRKAIRHEFDPPKEGLEAYQAVQTFLRKNASEGPLRRLLLDREGLGERLVSSRSALRQRVGQLATILARRGGDQMLSELRRLSDDPRLDTLVEPKVQATINAVRARVLHPQVSSRCKVIVFSHFNATARMLYKRLSESGVTAYFYDEETDSNVKERSVREFYQADHSVLVCPGEAEQGLNLQFASALINYDLPWDPMRIEQRIGRVQRLGSTASEVEIVNLVLKGTIEQDIIDLLERKIRMFEAVVGPVQAILGNLEKGEDPQQWIGNIFLDLPERTEDGETVSATEHCDRAISQAKQRSEEGGRSAMLNTLFAEADEIAGEHA
jgi:superfamily II DNA or RNA helicase